MATTLTVPPQVIPRLREGANRQLAYAADEIASSVLALENDGPPCEDRRRLDRLWALLDAIGWAGAVSGPVDLDLAEHSLAVLMAVDKAPPHMQVVLDDDERQYGSPEEMRELERAVRRAVARIERTTPPGVLAVPPVLIGRVREGAYGLLTVAGEVVVRSARSHTRPEPTSRTQFERAWALLGRLGWTTEKDTGEAVELRLAEYGVALHAAIETMIPLLATWLTELDPANASQAERTDELRLLRQLAVEARQAMTSE